MFLVAKYTIVLERVRLRAKILEIAELLKSWVRITKATGRALLSGVFTNSYFIDKVLKVLGGEGDSDKLIITV